MWKFLKYTFATFIGTSLGLLFFFVIAFGLVAGLIASSMSLEADSQEIEDASVLVISLDAPVVERVDPNPLKDFDILSMKSEFKLGLNDILRSLKRAETDDKIKGIVLKLRNPQVGISNIGEIRDAIEEFKMSGKFVLSYGDYQSQKAYYLSTVADRVYMQPEGTIEFKGLSAEVVFLTNTLEKLGLEPEIIRHGKFKSAVEPFTNTQMSRENKMQLSQMIHAIWQDMLNGISEQRAISVQELDSLAEMLTVSNMQKAKDTRLIDDVKYYDELLVELKDSLGVDDGDDISAVTLGSYINTNRQAFADANLAGGNKIAVVYAFGSIVPGEGETNNIGGDRIARAIRKARRDEAVKAIVLRVNSGGGSALASDVIWREMKLASEAKPTVVSMGDYAASGGYYIACPASVVVANPSTITGSIGVYGMLMNGEAMFDKIGLATDRVKTNAYADLGSFTRKMSDYERNVIGREIDNVYDSFISHVAEGRQQSKAYIDSIAQGRVWSGRDAVQIGLADMLGGISASLRVAKDLAKIDSYSLMELPESEDPFTLLMELLQADVEVYFAEKIMGDTYHYIQALQLKESFEGVQARVPFNLIVE